MADETYRTNDMTLAAVLVLNRFKYELETVDSKNGYKTAQWVFRAESSDELRSLVESYSNLTLRVTPQLLVKNLANIRNEMYAAIGAPDRRLRSVPSA